MKNLMNVCAQRHICVELEASEGGRRSSQLPFGALHCQRKAQLIIVVLTNHEIVLCETIYHDSDSDFLHICFF